MDIRHATLNDVPEMLELARVLHGMARFEELPFDEDKTRAGIEKFIIGDKKTYVSLVSIEDDKVVGVLIAYCMEPLFSTKKVAIEVLLYMVPEYRSSHRGDQLIQAYEYWAKLVGASRAIGGFMYGMDERLEAFWRRRGYQDLEKLYAKDLTNG